MEKRVYRIQKIDTIISYAYVEAENWEEAEDIASINNDIFEYASSASEIEFDGTIEITDKNGEVRYEH